MQLLQSKIVFVYRTYLIKVNIAQSDKATHAECRYFMTVIIYYITLINYELYSKLSFYETATTILLQNGSKLIDLDITHFCSLEI